MTVAETTSQTRNDYTGDGAAVAFNFTFEVLEEANSVLNKNFTLKVLLVESGIETEQVEDTDYTVVRDADTRLGVVTFTTAPTLTQDIVFLSDIASTQSTDYINIGTGKFPADSHEGTVDKLTLFARQQQEQIDRSILLPESSGLTNVTIPVSLENAGKVIAVNGTGDDLVASELADVGTAPVSSYIKTLLDDANASEARTTLDAERKAENLTAIAALQDADQFIVADNSDSDNSKKLTYSNLKAGLIASTTEKGLVELLTNAEQATATDTTRASTAASILSLFATSVSTTTGYLRIPVNVGGTFETFIIQMGADTVTGDSDLVVTLPIAFATLGFQAIACQGDAFNTGSDSGVGTRSLTTTQVTLRNGAATNLIRWIAIGK